MMTKPNAWGKRIKTAPTLGLVLLSEVDDEAELRR
jgi:hypothetical protein